METGEEEDDDGPIFSPAATRLYRPFHLGSNDDQLERSQIRAARAAARRQAAAVPPPSADNDSFDREQIMELYHNCIKLASENKINQKNTWDLGLIDHLSEIIRVESQGQRETNFQKASCSLEAGVRIYSMRVDSVHADVYKVLWAINRAGRGDDKENIKEGDHINDAQEGGFLKKEFEGKLSPLSTVEPSFEVLNVKKFNVAFTVDPLYHRSSAQFDEGGAKGLLLNNLGVYGDCRVLFDSFEAPKRYLTYEIQNDKSELIDLSFVKEAIEQMIIHMPTKTDISPTLRCIVDQLNLNSHRPTDLFSFSDQAVLQDDIVVNSHANCQGEAFDDCTRFSFDPNDNSDVINEPSIYVDPNFAGHQEEHNDYAFEEHDINEKSKKLAGLLSLSLGFTSRSNAWAGPDHWKYRKGLDQIPVSVSESEQTKKVKNRKRVLSDISFTKSLGKDLSGIFSPPKNPSSLLLPVNRVICDTTLPEDCHYRPAYLVRLFVLPNFTFLRRKEGKSSDEPGKQNHTSDPSESWDSESMINDPVNNEYVCTDIDDIGSLVRPPRQVNRVDISYDKVSKQIDVHALKDRLWNHIQEYIQMTEATMVSFRQVLRSCWSEHREKEMEISPHLFIICLLHLANEHCLVIRNHPGLDELDIHLPASI